MIPASLGGKLTVRFLCTDCNSRLGHRVDATAKSDPAIAAAIHGLAGRHPELAAKLSAGLGYVTQSAGGEAKARVVKGKLTVQSEQLKDDSLVQDTAEARKTIEKKLERAGYPVASISSALDVFDNMPENEPVELASGFEVVKWAVTSVAPDLSGPTVSPVLLAKIAFEFLACHIGSAVYRDAPQIVELRRMMSDFELQEPAVRVENLRADNDQPVHGIVLESVEPFVVVQVRLFGSLAYRVHFQKISLRDIDRHVYTHYLVSGRDGTRIVPASSEEPRILATDRD